MTDDTKLALARSLADRIDTDVLLAFSTVWEAVTGDDDLRSYVDADLAAVLAAVNVVATLAKRADTAARAAVAAHHTTGGWRLKEPGVGTIATKPKFQTRHDIGNAFTLVACQVYGEDGAPVDAVELPSQIKAVVTRCARLFSDSATLSLPALDEQGIPRSEVVRRTELDPEVTFTPAKDPT